MHLDLNTVTEVVRRPSERPGADWRPGDAFLAGGTWLFSEPQTHLRRLVDLTALGWAPLRADESGLEIGATCTITELYGFAPPADWPAAQLIRTSCEAFLASFKVWNAATVGGNICMALPAGPMITLTVALQAGYRLWAADGSERMPPAAEFVVGNNRNVLQPGELLRGVHIPAAGFAQAARPPALLPDQARPLDGVPGRHPRSRHRRGPADDHGGHHPSGVPDFRRPPRPRRPGGAYRRDRRGRMVRRRQRNTRPSQAPDPPLRRGRSAPNSPGTDRGDLHRQRQPSDREPEPGQCLRTFVRSLGWHGVKRVATQAIAAPARVAGRRAGTQLHHAGVPGRGQTGDDDRGLGTAEDLHRCSAASGTRRASSAASAPRA